MLNLDPALIQKIVVIVAILIVTPIVAWLLSKILNGWVRRAVSRSKGGLDDTLLNALKKPLIYFVLLVGLWLALQQADFMVAPDSQSLKTTFFIFYLVLGFVIALRLITGLVDWYAHDVAHLTETTFDDYILPFFRRVAVIILVLIALIVLLAHFDVNVSALVTTLGVGSLAIALAAQEVLGNMISGFIIMIDRPFRIGDRIELEELNTWGDVRDIGLHSTRILTRDHRLVSVPNSLIGKSRVVNHSIPSNQYRVQTHVTVAYGTNIDRAREVLIEAIRAEAWVMKNKPVEALFLEFHDSGLLFRVRCWIKNYVETRRVIDKMNTAIYKALGNNGIEMPFPQRVVHLRNSNHSKVEMAVDQSQQQEAQ
jgi:small-conductance mechanosensitive channel